MSKKIILLLSYFLIISTLFSCAKTPEEKVRDALISAELHLSNSECDKAISLLEGVGRQPENARFNITLASAYACRGGYSTTKFFSSDIAKTVAPAPLGGMSLYSTSTGTITSPLTEDSSFRDIQSAIDILQYAGNLSTTKNPTVIERDKKFSTLQAGDINALLAYLTMVQLGKVFRVYANTDANGVKGDGTAGNSCFLDYTGKTSALAIIALGGGGACDVAESTAGGHPQLDSGISTHRQRLCEGIVLFNGLLDVLPGVISAAGGEELGSLVNLKSEVDTLKADLETEDPTTAAVISVTSQYKCENDSQITLDNIYSYYAFLESFVQ